MIINNTQQVILYFFLSSAILKCMGRMLIIVIILVVIGLGGSITYGKSINSTQLESIVNEYRVSRGLSVLKHDDELCKIANERGLEISKNWSHRPLNYYIDNRDRLHRTEFGENLAKDIWNEKDILNTWISSKDHLANIIRPTYKTTCIAVYRNKYIVQIFSN